MSEKDSDALIPTEQDTVIFYDRPIVAVWLADERICVVLRWICEGLQLAPDPQVRRIRCTEHASIVLLGSRGDK